MDIRNSDDAVNHRIIFSPGAQKETARKRSVFLQPVVEEIKIDSKVILREREMGMLASYSNLGLTGHPRMPA
jgi:hypothetical protein